MSNAPEFKPVKKPSAPILLCPLTKCYAVDPIVLHIEDVDRYTESQEFDYEEDVVVGLGYLTARHLSDYERRFGFSLKTAIKAIVDLETYEELTTDVRVEAKEKLGISIEEGVYRAQSITLPGSPEMLLLETLAFILSRFGRITKKLEENSYELEDITFDEVFDHLDSRTLTFTTDEGASAVNEILARSGVFVYDAVNQEESEIDPLPESGKSTPQPKKNSPEKKEDAKETKSNSKRGRPKKAQ